MRSSTAAVALLLAVGVFSGTSVAGVAQAPGPGSLSAAATPLVTDAVPVPSGAELQPVAASSLVSVTLTLTNPHLGEIDRFLASVEDPGSPTYRHFVTYDQYVEAFAPPTSAVDQVTAALATEGARDLTVAPDRSSVTALLSVGAVDRMFGTTLETYGSMDRISLYTAVGAPSLPSDLMGAVSGIGGLSNLATAEFAAEFARGSSGVSEVVPSFVHDNETNENWYVGSDFTQAFQATELFPGAHSVTGATYPTSVAIATILASAFNQTYQANLPPWDPAVVDAYFNGTLAPSWPMPTLTGVPVTIGGVTPPLPASYGNRTDSTEFETENSLDLEMAGSLAPGASLYNYYFAAELIGPTATLGNAADYLAQDLQEALANDYGSQHLAMVSCSFGLPDLEDAAWDAELMTAAATGVTVVAASGDQGNAPDSASGRDDGQWPIWPATDATNTTGALSVGGVTDELDGSPTSYYNQTFLNLSYDANAGGIGSAVTWYDTTLPGGYVAGSEGGASTVFAEPSWQFHSAAQPAIVNATLVQGATSLGRTGPDLAMVANSTIATVFANATGVIFFTVLEGTSIAAPVLAGLLADVVAVENNQGGSGWSSLGFVNPEVYRIASYFAAFPATMHNPFQEIIEGRNWVFLAAPGWNPTTGWGQVSAPEFLSADRNATIADYQYTGPTPGLPAHASSSSGPAVPWTDIFLVFAVGVAVAIVVVVLSLRSSRREPPTGAVPWGAQMGAPHYPTPAPPAGEAAPGAMKLCPYCGAIRPAGPVPCPQCGAT